MTVIRHTSSDALAIAIAGSSLAARGPALHSDTARQ